MPTFKGNYAQYNERLTGEQNLKELFEQHNAFVNELSIALNNLDEENLNDAFLESIKAGVE